MLASESIDPTFIDPPGAYYGCILKPGDERNAIFAEQRHTLGFDDTETWNLDITIARFILPRLKRFKEVGNFYFVDGSPQNIKPMETNTDESNIILDKMISSFELLVEGDDLKPSTRIKIQEGLDLFAKHFMGLWW